MLIGISKTGIPGLGILAVALLAVVFPEGKSLGIMLPILMVADVFAVGYFRRRAHWQSLVRLIPATLAGIVIGYFTLDFLEPMHINRLIGGIALGILVMQALRQKGLLGGEHVPHQWIFACSMGLLAGFATMVANAAGPITIVYLLAMRLDKMRFMGTAAWFYLIVNWVKVPFQANLGFISAESLIFNTKLIPAILVGALLGIFVLKRIPQKAFQYVVLVLAAVVGARLLILG